MRLNEKVAIITGGNSGIGRATAEEFVAEGAKVLIAARDVPRGEQIVAQLRAKGGDALFVQTDVSQPDDVKRMVDAAVRQWSRIDVLFSNAGISIPADVVSCSLEDWNKTLEINLTGAFLCSKYTLPVMIDVGGGSIIFNSSQEAFIGSKDAAAYTATKGALNALARAMAIDHAQHRIRVNCICPGAVATEGLEAWFEAGGPDREAWLAMHPLGRFGRPSEVAKAVVYLASDESAWMTGTALVLDGGFIAH